MRRVFAVLIAAMLLSVSADAYSQFVDPNRRGVSDDILRLDQSNVGKDDKVNQIVTPKKTTGKEPKFEIRNDFQDYMKVEFVEVGYNKKTDLLSLTLRFTNKLSSRSVYVAHAKAESDKTGVIYMETVLFSAPENESVEIVIPLSKSVGFQEVNTMSFDVPFLGFGRIKLYNVPIKWI